MMRTASGLHCTKGTFLVIPGLRNRKRPIQHDKRRYKDRWRVEAIFCRLKNFRRIATRYNKLARTFLSAVDRAAAVAFWLRTSINPSGIACQHRDGNAMLAAGRRNTTCRPCWRRVPCDERQWPSAAGGSRQTRALGPDSGSDCAFGSLTAWMSQRTLPSNPIAESRPDR